MIFKRMYSPDNLDAKINDVVDAMPADRLDWAMQQVQRSIDKKSKPQNNCLICGSPRGNPAIVGNCNC